METKITSATAEEFAEIQKHLKGLPDAISCQIEKAERGLVGLDYAIRNRFGINEPIIYVPNNVKQIKTFDKEIVIYCQDYILRINEDMMKLKLHYVFVEPDKNGHP